MIDGWDASDTVSLASVGAAVIAIIVSLVTNARTVRQALRDRHLTERVTAYADFLTTQDARVDAYDRTRLLEELSRTFAEAGMNIVEARCVVSPPMVKNRFVLEVGDTSVLKATITRLRNIDSVFDAYRVTPTG